MAPVLLGRSRELSILADAVQTVAAGTGRVVHITGEAGIGKSSLVAAGTDELDRLGVTQRRCTVDETDRRRRLALVRALLPEIDRHPDPLATRPRRVPARATHGWASLTASEQNIVSLVGEGLTTPRSASGCTSSGAPWSRTRAGCTPSSAWVPGGNSSPPPYGTPPGTTASRERLGRQRGCRPGCPRPAPRHRPW